MHDRTVNEPRATRTGNPRGCSRPAPDRDGRDPGHLPGTDPGSDGLSSAQGPVVPGPGDGEGDPRGLDVHEQPVRVERGTREIIERHRGGRAGNRPGPDVGGEVEELAVVVDTSQERLAGPV